MSKKIREKSAETPRKMPSFKLQDGAVAPSFSVPLDDGGRLTSTDFTGKRLVIFFYPRAGTEGCTLEASDFSRLAPEFAANNIAILGVSADPPQALQRFRQKHALTILLGSDESHAMLEAFGVWAEKSMYGKTFMGILRTTFLVDADGRIEKIWHNVKAKGHAEAVLEAVRAASQT